MKRLKHLSIITLLAATFLPAAGLWAQADVDLLFQTSGNDGYRASLDAQEADYLAQLDSGVDIDAARMALILIKLARIELEAASAAGQISDGSDEIDLALADLAERIGDGFSDVVVEPDADAEGGSIEARIDSATGDIDAALEDFANVLDGEVGDISDLAADLLDGDGPFEVTFRIEGDGTRTAEAVTITRDDLDQLADG